MDSETRPRHLRTHLPRWSYALTAAMLLGVLVPSVVVWVRTEGTLETHTLNAHGEQSEPVPWRPGALAVVLVFAGIGCGPGAMILGLALFLILRRVARNRPSADEGPLLVKGMIWGALLAFLNVPGYLAFIFFLGDPLAAVRLGALFAITGATCGFWIGWEAFKEEHPERGFFPRFSLRTLIAFAFGWGLLLMLFMPVR